MRELTLHEKISIKGVFKYKGATIPKLNMQEAVFLWYRFCGTPISRFFLCKTH